MKVMLADIETDALAAAVKSLHDLGLDVRGVTCDVADPASVERAAEASYEAFGNVHVVCNNAGVTTRADPWTGPLSAWQWVLGVNLWGVIHGVRAFLPRLVEQGEGHIVNTSSMAGLMPGLSPAYDAGKHAVVAVTEDLHLDVLRARDVLLEKDRRIAEGALRLALRLVEERIEIRPICILGLSWDHRALDGVYAARFLGALRERLQSLS